ncbi:MAG TPA: septum formation initiator family protein [Candidatus Paceibacterota bacterium]|nr:septum formation initiator family protein [Candidatus Paceibacterota bacterium]
MRSILQRKVVSVILIIGAAWLGLDLYHISSQQGSETAQLNDLKARISDAQRQNQILASSSDYFHSDAYLEHQARTKLNFKLPGEEVAFVYPDDSSHSMAVKASTKPQMPNWKKWWYYVLGQ